MFVNVTTLAVTCTCEVIVLTSSCWVFRDPRGSMWELTNLLSPSPSGLPARFGPSPKTVLLFTGDLSLLRAPQVREQRILFLSKTFVECLCAC